MNSGDNVTIQIRPMRKTDLPAILEMETLCFSIPWTKNMFHEELENEQARYLVGICDGQVAGYVGYWAILDEGHITNVAVHPMMRRRGIAKAMLHQLIQMAGAEGIHSLTLEVRKGNAAAIALYESFGFQTAGVRKKYYDDNGEDALILWADVE
jgi:[ribosomal protein S18]-alanine N-acetyltransferase